MEFKDKVLFVRGKLLLTQTQLAKEIGVSYISIIRWESGQRMPRFLHQKAFEQFCERKGITFEE